MLAALVAGGGFVAAQAQAPNPDEHAAHHPAKAGGAPPAGAAPADAQPAQGGMMGGGMMGGGMMGMMGGGMCPMMGGGGMMMGGAKTKVDVKKIDKGVTITLTSPDAATVTRIQKMAEAMRLMHEAMAQ
jgi:hypothetical protein